MNECNSTGKIYFTHTKLNNQIVLRFSIGQTNTEKEHLEMAWTLIHEKVKEILN